MNTLGQSFLSRVLNEEIVSGQPTKNSPEDDFKKYIIEILKCLDLFDGKNLTQKQVEKAIKSRIDIDKHSDLKIKDTVKTLNALCKNLKEIK